MWQAAGFVPSRMVRELDAHSQRLFSPSGPEVVPLHFGDPDFPTPEHICTALLAAIREGATHYAALDGDPELRAALAGEVSRTAGRAYRPEQIVLSHGGIAGVAATILATIEASQAVLLPEPTYSLYADLVRMAGGEIRFVRNRDDLHLDVEAIDAAAPGARIVVICNPCNPTGVVYSRAELEELAEVAERHDLLVVADEAYASIVFDGAGFVSALEVERLAERLVYVQTFSKTYAMAGWRLGWVAASPAVATAVGRVHRSINGPLNTAVQRAALAAVTGPLDFCRSMRAEYQARRDIVVRMLAAVPGAELRAPQATFYAFVRHPGGLSSREFVRRALEHGVAVRPGSEFGPGGEGYIRLAFCVSRERLTDGLGRLGALIGELA
jgi:aspartate/methionine/tyrosine aminotransferase